MAHRVGEVWMYTRLTKDLRDRFKTACEKNSLSVTDEISGYLKTRLAELESLEELPPDRTTRGVFRIGAFVLESEKDSLRIGLRKRKSSISEDLANWIEDRTKILEKGTPNWRTARNAIDSTPHL